MGMMDTSAAYAYQEKMRRALELESAGMQLHAIQQFLAIIREFPAENEPLLHLASVYEHMRNAPAALRLLQQRIDDDPGNKEVRVYLGHLYFRNRQWEQTIEVFSYLPPEDEPLAEFFVGYAYFQLKEYLLAKKSFKNFIRYGESTDLIQDAYIYLAKVNLNLHECKEALVYLDKADAYFSGHFEVQFLYAMAYYYLAMYTHAAEAVRNALALEPNDLLTLEWASRIYLQQGQYLLAEEAMHKAIKEGVEPSAEFYGRLGMVSYYLGKISEARMYSGMALTINANEALAQATVNLLVVQEAKNAQ